MKYTIYLSPSHVALTQNTGIECEGYAIHQENRGVFYFLSKENLDSYNEGKQCSAGYIPMSNIHSIILNK